MDFRFQNNQVLCCSDIHRFSRHFVQTPPALGSCSTFIPSQCLCSGQTGPLFRKTRACGGRSDMQQESGLRSDFCWVVSWVPRERDSPFHSRADFSSTTSQRPPSFRACSVALEQLRSQEGEAGLWSPGCLEDQLPWFLCSLMADHNPQTGKRFLLNGPKRPKNFCPVRQKESSSPPADHRSSCAGLSEMITTQP